MKSSARPVLRTTVGRLAVTAVATLASVSATAPVALAAEGDLAPETAETPEGPAAAAMPVDSTEPAPVETAEEPEPAPQAPPAPDQSGSLTEPSGDEVPTGEEPGEVTAQEAEDEPVLDPGEELLDEEYGPQSFRINVSREAGDYYQIPSDGVTVSMTVYEGEEIVGYLFCSAQDVTTDGTVECAEPGTGRTVFELAPGQSVVIGWPTRDANNVRQLDACLAAECPTDVQDVDIVLGGDVPRVLASRSAEALPGVPATLSPLDYDDVDDPNTSVQIVTPPQNGSATVTEAGDIVYTSTEDFTGTDTLRYTLTNTNGTSAVAEMAFEVSEDAFQPNFGSQKYRVGVQIESGAYVPAGTTTVGSTFSIETTDVDGNVTTTTCTTTPDRGIGSSATGSSCGDETIEFGEFFFGTYFTAPAGATVRVTQVSVPEGAALVVDPDTEVLEPCDTNVTICDAGAINGLEFTNAGSILPETAPDEATADQGGPAIDVDVLANDTSDDPDTTLSVTPIPEDQGTIEVVGEPAAQPPVDEEPPVVLPPVDEEPPVILLGSPGRSAAARSAAEPVTTLAVPSAGTLALRYTPSADFSGTIPVTYTVTNSNGSTTGTLTITVRPSDVAPVDPTDPDDADDTKDADDTDDRVGDRAVATGALPDTGGPDLALLGVAGALLVAGGTIARSRRRGDA